ncbi:hypothetical protein EBB07_29165 [Paenibacillaceae bacterium]|nr:hypothetical protein EBB07_29165 [Paenibacillaceae bacterium]
MSGKWIGLEVNISGSYYETKCKELEKRSGGVYNAGTLYKFNSRFGESYYISDKEAVEKIEKLLENDPAEIIEYLYNLVIQKFGVIDFVVRVGHKIAEQRSEGYKVGKLAAQEKMREALGL